MESTLYSPLAARYTGEAVREAPWTEGDVVRKLRLVAGWKLKHLAKHSGVSLTMIHELEMGKTKEAKRATLTRIAAAFGLTLRDLLDLVPQKPVRLDVSAPHVETRISASLTERRPSEAAQKKGHGSRG